MPTGFYKRTPEHNANISKGLKGHAPWSKGKKWSSEARLKLSESRKGVVFSEEHKLNISRARKGMKLSDEHRANISKSKTGLTEELSGSWLGDDVGYQGVHIWIRKKLGRPRECENCETIESKAYHWANLSGEYKRDLSDWARLCASCHMIIDNVANRAWVTRRAK